MAYFRSLAGGPGALARSARSAALAVPLLALQAVCAPVATAVDEVRPLDNDCSAGYVAFTFDDGPDLNTSAVMSELTRLKVKGVFFTIGKKVATPSGTQTVRALRDAGFGVQVHTWDHRSLTGSSTKTAPLTEQEVAAELGNGASAIMDAGLPQPTLYRPPYGDVNAFDDAIAQRLGLRIVMAWGTNIVSSNDWAGDSPSQIVTNVTSKLKADAIVTMHDGLGQPSLNTAAAMQPIVDYMNANHLCSTDQIRADATGGRVPVPVPLPPATGNLVVNPSMELLRYGSNATAEPLCFQHSGYKLANNTAAWKLTGDARSGTVAQNVTITDWTAGDRKIVMSQRNNENATCASPAQPGKRYNLWVYYKGDWATSGTAATTARITTYYRTSTGAWTYWASGPAVVPTAFAWNLAYVQTSPLPEGATAVSYGLTLQGNGTVTTDDYTMTVAP